MTDEAPVPIIKQIMIEEEPELKITVQFSNHEDIVFLGEEAKEYYEKIKKQNTNYDWEKGEYKSKIVDLK